MERRKKKDNSLYRDHKLFLSEDWFEVVRIDYGIASILLFRIDILLFNKSIWFGAKMTRIESDDKIELKEILRLSHLSLGQYLSSREILKVFMIHNNINRIDQTL